MCAALVDTTQQFSKVVVPLTLLTADTGIFSLFHSSHSGRCVSGVTPGFQLVHP